MSRGRPALKNRHQPGRRLVRGGTDENADQIAVDIALLSSVATQMMAGDEVKIAGKKLVVWHTSRNHLKAVSFEIDCHKYEAIEQNPEKPSQWGQLARIGHQVVQFKDCETNRFVAVAVDGNVKVYGHGTKK